MYFLILALIRELSPKTESQKYLQSQALQFGADMMQSQWN